MTSGFCFFPGGDYDIDKLKEYVEEAAAKICAAVAGVCKEHGFDLQDAAASNIQKIMARKEKGTIQGDGSNR